MESVTISFWPTVSLRVARNETLASAVNARHLSVGHFVVDKCIEEVHVPSLAKQHLSK